MNLAEYAEIRDLIDELDGCISDLTPNEHEMFSHLRSKYETPTVGAFDDKTCLEVILRNVGIRREMGLKPAQAMRSIDLPRK